MIEELQQLKSQLLELPTDTAQQSEVVWKAIQCVNTIQAMKQIKGETFYTIGSFRSRLHELNRLIFNKQQEE